MYPICVMQEYLSFKRGSTPAFLCGLKLYCSSLVILQFIFRVLISDYFCHQKFYFLGGLYMRLVDMFEAVKGNAEEKLAGQISLTENWLVAKGYTSLKRESRGTSNTF